MIEKEILQGVTNVFDFSKSQLADELLFQPTQTIDAFDKNLPDNLNSKSLTHGCACWLSVSTQSAPLIAIASSYSHEVWCNHSSTVKVFQPIRLILRKIKSKEVKIKQLMLQKQSLWYSQLPRAEDTSCKVVYQFTGH